MGDTTLDQLKNNCESIAETIERLAEGYCYCNECYEYVKELEHCGEDTETLHDYLEDSLGIRLITELNGKLLGARITMAWGGPNIYVDTQSHFVEGYWGVDEYKVRLSDNAVGRIYEEIEEMRYY